MLAPNRNGAQSSLLTTSRLPPSEQEMLALAEAYTASVKEESTMTAEQLATRHVGKRDPKRHLEDAVEKAMGGVVVQSLGMGVLGEL